MAINLEQFKRKTGPLDLSQFKKAEPRTTAGKFNVPEAQGERASRVQRFQREATASTKEAEKASSPLGFAANFGKALVSNIAPSQVGLGKTIGGILTQGGKADTALQESTAQGEDIKVSLLQRIREKEARGEDAERLKQSYNRLTGDVETARGAAADLVQLPTNIQAAGQVGGTALDLLTAGTFSKAKTGAMGTGQLAKGATPAVKTAATAVGIPEIGAIAGQKASGLLTKQGAKNIATGAGIGFASDVTLGAQGLRGEDREGVKALIPGIGTAIGAAIPLTSEIATSIKNFKTGDARIAAKRVQALDDLQSKNKQVDTIFKASERKGVDAKKVLSETNLLNGAVDTDGRISADSALANFDEFIKPFEGQVRKSLEEEGRTLPVNQVVNDAREFIDASRLAAPQKAELQREIARSLEAFSQFDGNNVPLASIHDTKVFLGQNNNYLNPAKDIVDKEAARFLKELVENNSVVMDVKSYNTELSHLYAVRDVLTKLDRKVVSGGRLGKYFASTVGAMAGGSAGGPLGAIIGAEAGAKAKGGIMSRAFGGNIGKAPAPSKKLLQSQSPLKTGKAAIPEVVLPKTKKAIPDVEIQSKSRGSRQTNQTTTIIPIKKGITKKATPKKTKPQMTSVGIPKGTSDKDLVTMRDFIDMVNGSYKPSAKEKALLKQQMQDVADKLNMKKLASGDRALASEIDKILESAQFSETLPVIR